MPAEDPIKPFSTAESRYSPKSWKRKEISDAYGFIHTNSLTNRIEDTYIICVQHHGYQYN